MVNETKAEQLVILLVPACSAPGYAQEEYVDGSGEITSNGSRSPLVDMTWPRAPGGGRTVEVIGDIGISLEVWPSPA